MRNLFTLDDGHCSDNLPVYERPSVRGIIIKNGKIALTINNAGTYGIPGGGKEIGETDLDTLIREVREETGLVVIPSSVKEFGDVLRIEKGKRNGQYVKFCQHNYYYTCDVEDKTVEQNLDENEKLDGYKLVWAFPIEAVETNRRLMTASRNPMSLERTAKVIELVYDKMYYTQPYLKELNCTVISVNKTDSATEVKTDRTIFYPECGGQPGDRGWIGDYKVLDTRKDDDGSSVLILSKEDCPAVGEELCLKLDWDHRYKFMVMHACQHMTSGMLFNMFKIGTVSVHLGEEYMTIETDRGQIDHSTIEQLIQAENRAIEEGHEIVYHEMSHKEAEALGLRRSIKVDTDVRIVEIEGIDKIACGGVHVANTSEIGLITYLGQEQIRGHVRLFFSCGEVARQNANNYQKILSEINEKLSCSFEDMPKNIASLTEEYAVLKSQNQNLSQKLASLILDKNTVNDIAVFEDTDKINLQSYAACVDAKENLALCVVQKNGDKANWLIALKGRFEKLEFATIKEKMFTLIDAKGGGRLPVFQGIGTKADSNSLKAFSEEFKNLL